jgi:WD40 repeat protein
MLSKIEFLGSLYGLSSSPDGLQLLAATDKGFIYRVRTADFSKMLLSETHTKEVLHAIYAVGNKDSERFLTSSADGSLRLWDANDYSAVTRCAILTPGNPLVSLFTEEVILSGWSDGKIRTFRTDNGDPLWNIDNAHKGGVSALDLSHNNKFLVSGGVAGEVRVWEIKTKDLVTHLKEHTAKVTNVHIFADDTFALSCAKDCCILCWDLKNERRVTAHTQRMGGINSIAVCGDERVYLSTGQERKITFWDLRQSTATKIINTSPIANEDDELQSVALSLDNKYFATGGTLGIVRVWDMATQKVIGEAKAHSGVITCVTFSPDGKQIVSTGTDGMTMIWNLFMN